MRLSPGSACLVFRFDKRHFKLATTPRARRGLVREARGTALAAGDDFWAPYLQPAHYRLDLIKYAALYEPANDPSRDRRSAGLLAPTHRRYLQRGDLRQHPR
jgi:hypothetical protein